MEKEHSASGRQKIRLFLEGREVPCIQASVTSSAGQPKIAGIELVPLTVIKFIRPRTQVHLFVKDSLTFGDDNFYLCFEGEVIGRSMLKSQDGRSLSITAVDYSSYMDDTKAYILSPSYVAGRLADISGSEPSLFAEAAANATVATKLNTTSNQNVTIIDILLKTARGGEGDKSIDIPQGCYELSKTLADTNGFYKAAYDRLKIIDRLSVFSSGKTRDFLKSIKIEEFLKSFAGAVGGLTSFRRLISEVLGLIFHEFVTIPFPSKIIKNGKYSIKEFLFVPDTFMLPPPRCNVIFPNQQVSLQFRDDFRAAPTRAGFRYSFPVAGSADGTELTYPIVYHPAPFSDFMFCRKDATEAERASGFGPSSLLKTKDGKSYANLDLCFRRPSKDSAGNANTVGPATNPTMTSADWLSNEESLKGVYYSTEVLTPNYTSLVRTVSEGKNESDPEGRTKFMRGISKHLFHKKRYAARQASADIVFNPYLATGFTALFIDDSGAGQSFVAKLESVSHNFTTTGFTTSVTLSHARDFDEVDFMTGGVGEPPMPEWFSEDIFGKAEGEDKTLYNAETRYLYESEHAITKDEVKRRGNVKSPTIFPKLSEFYKEILGCESITGVEIVPPENKNKKIARTLVTIKGATQYLINTFKGAQTQENRDKFVRNYTKRSIPTMQESFGFLGARAKSGKTPEEFAVFGGGRFDGDYSDEDVLKLKREIIDRYITQLKEKRGFRG